MDELLRTGVRYLLKAALVGLTALVTAVVSFLVAAPAHAVTPTGTGGIFVPASGRLLDTRVSPNTPLTANAWRTVQVAGQSGLPTDGIGSVVVAATAVGMADAGELLGRPDSTTATTTMVTYASVDFGATENAATVAVGDDGTIQIEATTNTNVVLDLEGYYTSDDVDGTAPGGFVPVAGARIVDTRSGVGAPGSAIAPGQSLTIQVGGQSGVPADASGVVANFIAISTATTGGYLTPYATGSTKPTRSLNYPAGQTTSLTARVALSASGQLTVTNSLGTTDLVVDLQGYFTAASAGGALFTPAAGVLYDTTVSPNTALAANQTRVIPVSGHSGMPAMGSGITAVVLLVTATKSTDNQENTTIWPDGTTEPVATAINSTSSPATRSNTVTVALGNRRQDRRSKQQHYRH